MIPNLEWEEKTGIKSSIYVYGMQTANPFFRSSSGQNVWVTSRALMRAHTKNVIDIDKKESIVGFVGMECHKIFLNKIL